LTKIYKSM